MILHLYTYMNVALTIPKHIEHVRCIYLYIGALTSLKFPKI